MSYTESSLKALTVVKLKEILANHSLPVTGKKDDLISRILESNLSTTDDQPTIDPTSTATDEPDGQGVGTAQELGPAAATLDEPENGATPAIQHDQPEPEPQGPTEQEKEQQRQEALKQEEEKRKARLARFGGGGGASSAAGNGETEIDQAKKKRAERFGVPLDQEQDQQTKLNKSLELLDKPLGSNRRERKPKPTSTVNSKTNPPNEQTIAQKTGNPQAAAEPAAAVAADPELQKRLAEDEEKKKKRAARFGAPPSGASEPQEKKTKTD